MTSKKLQSPYCLSSQKRTLDLALAVPGIILSSPAIVAIAAVLWLDSKNPIFFTQERSGLNGKSFKIIKFRTMKINAHVEQKRYKKLNEADGPVFKIYNDPRLTKFGKFLAHTGLDELPQLLNVIRGDMSMVGPRPLPLSEAKNVPAKYHRGSVKPGVTSLWVVQGSHKLKFKKWMELDEYYCKNATILTDIKIILKTIGVVAVYLVKKIQEQFRNSLKLANI